MTETDACWDAPENTDILFTEVQELFGDDLTMDDVVIPSVVDHRGKTTTYNQFEQEETHKACGSYATRHIINLSNKLTGGTIDNPRRLWNRFCIAYTTPTYNPIKEGSSLQDQNKFLRKLGLSEGEYRIPLTTIDETVLAVRMAISKGHFINTGSKKIDWGKTRASKDKVAVIGTGAPHIIMLGGFDDNTKHFFAQQSSGDGGYDKGWMKIRYKDIGCLFSMYAIIDRAMPSTLLKIRNLINEKKKVSVYKVKVIDGKPTLGRRPK